MKNFSNTDFSMMPSIDNEYFNLYFCGKKVYQDSACEDLYDEESAYSFFSEMIDAIADEWTSKVKSAIEMGFEPSLSQDINDIMIEAEQYIVANTSDED